MNFVDHLANYAAYHRDPRNITTHLFGVPVIVFAVMVLLARPGFELFGLTITPAHLGLLATLAFYLRLNLVFALIMTVIMGSALIWALSIAQESTTLWLSTGVGLFIAGWVVQFIGHHYEGKKPAFVDDLVGLLIGPLFVMAEVLFALGMFKQLKADIDGRVGPVRKNENLNASAQ